MQLHIYALNPFSVESVLPYFTQSFYILSSHNLSQFALPALPSHVKYRSSVPEMVSVDPSNASIVVRSPLLFSSHYYDFQIDAIDAQTPSLSCSIALRIFFAQNKHPPRLSINATEQTIETSSSKFLYQIQAYDPDLLLNDQSQLFPPAIEYEIDPAANIEIERYTGRIFLKSFSDKKINFTLIMTDFGQPHRLTTKQQLIFDIKSHESISLSIFLLSVSIFLLIVLLCIVLLVVICCCCCCYPTTTTTDDTTWKNISPTAPDTRLIDHEYVRVLLR